MLVTALTLVGLFTDPVSAQTGGGYDLTWSSVDGGGVMNATGGDYKAGGTIGQHDAAKLAGGVYTVSGGFWVLTGSSCEAANRPLPIEDWNSTTMELIGSATCSPGECPNTSTCMDGGCYFTYNRYLLFQPNNAGQLVALRVTHVGSGASRWIDSNIQQVVHNNNDPAMLSYTFTHPDGSEPDYAVWPEQPFAVTGCFIVPGEEYEIQAITEACDAALAGSYSAAVTLSTALFGDAVSTLSPLGPDAFAYPPQGPLVDVMDMTAIVEGFANTNWTSKLYCDLIGLADNPSFNNAVIDVSDMTAVVDAFGGGSYPGMPPPECP